MVLGKKFPIRKNEICRVCVTGASGFVGSVLIDRLLEKGLSIRVLTRSKKKTFPRGVDIFIGDLTLSDNDIDKFVFGCDVLINCAGDTLDLNQMQKLHVEGVERLIRSINRAYKNNARPLHFVQLSSVGAYGAGRMPGHPRVVLETSEVEPQGEYELTKTLADEIIKEKSILNSYTYTILRPSNIVGLKMPNQSFRQLLSIIKNKRFFYIGSKSSISTYVHVDDVVDAILICAKDDRAKNQVFNLSNDCPLTDIVEKVSNHYGFTDNFACVPEKIVRLSVFILNQFIRFPLSKSRIDALVSKTTYPTNKIENVLGFIPSRPISLFAVEYLKKFNEKK